MDTITGQNREVLRRMEPMARHSGNEGKDPCRAWEACRLRGTAPILGIWHGRWAVREWTPGWEPRRGPISRWQDPSNYTWGRVHVSVPGADKDTRAEKEPGSWRLQGEDSRSGTRGETSISTCLRRRQNSSSVMGRALKADPRTWGSRPWSPGPLDHSPAGPGTGIPGSSQQQGKRVPNCGKWEFLDLENTPGLTGTTNSCRVILFFIIKQQTRVVKKIR